MDSALSTVNKKNIYIDECFMMVYSSLNEEITLFSNFYTIIYNYFKYGSMDVLVCIDYSDTSNVLVTKFIC